jgi:hypothetical protein
MKSGRRKAEGKKCFKLVAIALLFTLIKQSFPISNHSLSSLFRPSTKDGRRKAEDGREEVL